MSNKSDSRKEERREQILEAAGSCFFRYGFHGAGMRDIAKEAGVTLETIYRYFESKEALFEAIAQSSGEILPPGYQQLLELIDDPAKGLAGLPMYVLGEEFDPEETRLVAELIAEASRNPRIQAILAKQDACFKTQIVQAIEKAQRLGTADANLDPEATAMTIFALLQGLDVYAATHQDFDHAALVVSASTAISRILGSESRFTRADLETATMKAVALYEESQLQGA